MMAHLVRHALVVALLIAAATWPVIAGHAPAHPPPCGKSAEISKHLTETYKEQPVAVGLQNNGNLLQIWASEDGASWTAVSLHPKGTACIAAAGKNFEMLHSFEEPA